MWNPVDHIFRKNRRVNTDILTCCSRNSAQHQPRAPAVSQPREKTSIRQLLRRSQNHQKVNFSYNPLPTPIHNYHTTNYIVDRYILKPSQCSLVLPDLNSQSATEPLHEQLKTPPSKGRTAERQWSSQGLPRREAYKRGKLFNVARRSQYEIQDESSSEHHSEVIEDYHSLMSKIQENRLEDSGSERA